MYCGFEAVAENIEEWRGNLVTRFKQYASRNSDIQLFLVVILMLVLAHLYRLG